MKTIELDPIITRLFHRWIEKTHPSMNSNNFTVQKELKDGVCIFNFTHEKIADLEGLSLHSWTGSDKVRYVNEYSLLFNLQS
jgi:hypothetical protein